MKKQNYLSKAALGATLAIAIFGSATLALADPAQPIEPAPIIETEDQTGTENTVDRLPSRAMVSGSIVEIGEGWVQIQHPNPEAVHANLILNYDALTYILNNQSGDPEGSDALKVGDYIYAYVNPVMTMSEPAQSYAQLILCNLAMDAGAASYLEIDSVTVLENGDVQLTCDDGTVLTVTDETELSPHLTRNMIYKEMLQSGDKILAWFGLGSQDSPGKVMVFPYAYNGQLAIDEDGIHINGEAAELAPNEALYEQDGQLMLPLRKCAEALGCEVTWDAAAREVVVVDGEGESYRFLADGEQVSTGETDFYLMQPLSVQDGVSFLSAADFAHLHNLKYVQ